MSKIEGTLGGAMHCTIGEWTAPAHRYIDANDFAERLLDAWDTADKEKKKDIVAIISDIVVPILSGTPTANVKEVVEAEWVWRERFGETGLVLMCSECRESHGANESKQYCSNCGAYMTNAKVEI